MLTEFIISVALNSGKLYGRMRKIAQAFTRARSGIKMAGYRKNVSAVLSKACIPWVQTASFPNRRSQTGDLTWIGLLNLDRHVVM